VFRGFTQESKMDRRLRNVGSVAAVWIGMVWMTGSAIACTRVFWNTNKPARVAGRTTDLAIDDNPWMVVYPRVLERDGKAGDNSLKWKSKYGIVAMTAFGVAADDGINEHGLAAHMINLPDTEYEVRDNRLGIGNLLWIQYFLGIANLNLFRVSLEDVDFQEGAPVQHFDPMAPGLCGEMFPLP
jgi:penicillin V acylase-like amidase (Ntn superfamily)